MGIKRRLILVLQWLAGWLQRAATFFSLRAEKLAAPPANAAPPTPDGPRDNPAQGTNVRPPAHWLERVRSAGPPPDWHARVAEAAPELLQMVDTEPERSDLRGRARRTSLVLPIPSPRTRPIDRPGSRAQGRNKRRRERPAESASPYPVEEPARSFVGDEEAGDTDTPDRPGFSPENRFNRRWAASTTNFEPQDAGNPLTALTEENLSTPHSIGSSLDPAGSESGNIAYVTPQMAGLDGSRPENSAGGNHQHNGTGRKPGRQDSSANITQPAAGGNPLFPFLAPAGLASVQTRPVDRQPETKIHEGTATNWPDLPGLESPAGTSRLQTTPAIRDYWPELLPAEELPLAASSHIHHEEQRRRRIDAEQRGENRRGTSRIFN